MNTLSKFALCAGLAAAIGFAAAQAAGPLANPNPATAPQMNPQGHDAAPQAAGPTANGNAPLAPRAQPLPPNVDAGKVMAAGADNSRDIFLTLDRTHRGFLDKSDVRSNQYLSSHFADCDTNQDGHLSREEVDACMPQKSKSND